MKGAPLPPMNRSNTALVLHDMQNDFIKESLSRPEMQAIVKRTKALIDLARSLPIPVIYTKVETDPAMTFPSERAPYLRRPGSEARRPAPSAAKATRRPTTVSSRARKAGRGRPFLPGPRSRRGSQG